MRELKFRAWDKNTNKWQYFVAGEQWANNGSVIMQFTGLKDKNGKEIYEGDIVTATISGLITYHMKSVVDFENGCFGIRALEDEVLVDSKGKFKSFDGCDTKQLIEVIGNIYENPELLIKPTK